MQQIYEHNNNKLNPYQQEKKSKSKKQLTDPNTTDM